MEGGASDVDRALHDRGGERDIPVAGPDRSLVQRRGSTQPPSLTRPLGAPAPPVSEGTVTDPERVFRTLFPDSQTSNDPPLGSFVVPTDRHVQTQVYIHPHTHIYTYKHIRTYTWTYVRVHVNKCMYVCTHIHTSVRYVQTYRYTLKYTHVYMHECT